MSDWRNARVLVTGHTGFKGSWLCSWLLAAGADVTGFALAPATDPNLFGVLHLGDDMASYTGDIRDQAAVERVVRAAAPQVVFHLAAQAIVLDSIDDPVTTYATNVMGTVHLLEAVRRHPSAEAVVVVTSDKCYENDGSDRAYREHDGLGGREPYSSSKACAELVTSAYRRTYFGSGPAVATARAGNVIGGGDWSRHRIIPDIARALASGADPVLRLPKAIRPWQHVLDAISGYTLLAERLRSGKDVTGAWNFGPDASAMRTTVDVAERFLKRWGGSTTYRVEHASSEHETMALRLDSGQAKERLGWNPTLTFDAAVDWTAAWYRERHDGGDPRALTSTQLSDHDALRLIAAR